MNRRKLTGLILLLCMFVCPALAATVDDLSTGMEFFDGSPWEYSKDPHIAPAAWFVMTANGFDPYMFTGNS